MQLRTTQKMWGTVSQASNTNITKQKPEYIIENGMEETLVITRL